MSEYNANLASQRLSQSTTFDKCNDKPHGPVIIVVDDHEDNLFFVSHITECMKLRCLTACHSEEFLQTLQFVRPNLILLDIKLPEMNGFDLLKIVRQDFQYIDVPVIAMTAMVGVDVRTRLYGSGFTDYLSKPFSIDALKSLLLHYLSLNEAQSTVVLGCSV